mmetsp:Transcript_96626/g.312098  ORF Transcript_96626/g.312098 Transcript_96626/m.312098 type:complete len:238 (+) Transcript_96626:149-862(+)
MAGMNSPMISSTSSMPKAPPSASTSGSLDLVSSSLGRMQRYQSQLVKATWVRAPRKFILLSLHATLTALQFFCFSTVPTAAASSSSSLFEGCASSSPLSASAPAAPSASASMDSPSIAASSASSSSSSSPSSCFTPTSLARSCIQSPKLRCVSRSSGGIAPSMESHSTCESEFVPLTTFFKTIASSSGSGSTISFASIRLVSASLPSLRASFRSSKASECMTAAWICASVRIAPPHF